MNKNTFVFRNSSVEYLFGHKNYCYSELDSIIFDSSFNKYIFFYLCPIDVDYRTKIAFIDDYKLRLELILSKLKDDDELIVLTIEDFLYDSEINSDFVLLNTINEFNNSLRNLQQSNRNIKIVDLKKFTINYSTEQLIDWRYFYLSKSIINPKLKNEFNKWWENRLREFLQIRKKCLILDMDNTLWGGIVGEDGIHGIKIGDNYPGNIYKHFQQSILEMKKTGVIIAACSKNNLSDIKDLWKNNDQLILKENDFACLKINWENKASNIIKISRELNIGLDSMVFIDDNPVERELIKQVLPEVVCPDFPDKTHQLFTFIKNIKENYFSTHRITEEDLLKTDNYKNNIKRNDHKLTFKNIDSYLKSLEIKLVVQEFKKDNCQRLSQLTQKTNQFNFTTIRYSESDLIKIHANSGKIFSLSVSDKFGNLGITGLLIIKEKTIGICEIDTFLMSCRILGRNIEIVFLKLILIKLKNSGFNIVESKFVKTNKNSQLENFFSNYYFAEKFANKSEKRYSLDLNNNEIEFSKSELEIFKII